MRIEAILFVNWIFWAALSAGTLLVVGMTERLGGTTRGYRLFMAWLLVVFAGILVASDLALPAGAEASATTELRRPLTFAFAAGALAYLVASLAGWPRAWLADRLRAGRDRGARRAGGGRRQRQRRPVRRRSSCSPPSRSGRSTRRMLLGHWYLVTPKLSPAPLRRMMWLLVGSLALQGVAFAACRARRRSTGPRWRPRHAHLAAPGGRDPAADRGSHAGHRAPRARASLQASTGLLYIGLALVMAGSIAGASLTYLTGVPV